MAHGGSISAIVQLKGHEDNRRFGVIVTSYGGGQTEVALCNDGMEKRRAAYHLTHLEGP